MAVKHLFTNCKQYFFFIFLYRLRYSIRRFLYVTPRLASFLSRSIGNASKNRNPDYFDRELSGPKSFYFGGIPYVEARRALIPVVIRHAVPHFKHVLDVGCAGGGLAVNLLKEGVERYIGIDISDYAIRKAERDLLKIKRDADVRFHACDLCEFVLEDGERFDVIVFSEVLYYLSVQEAAEQVERFSGWLRPNGGLCISMKDDPKSHAIYRSISQRFKHAGSILYQFNRANHGVKNRIAVNKESPRFTTAIFILSEEL